MPKHRVISDHDWELEYSPVVADDGSLAWDDPTDELFTWSYQDGVGGGTYLINGFDHSAYAYAHCSVPWVSGEDITVIIESDDEYMARQREDLVHNAIEDFYMEKNEDYLKVVGPFYGQTRET